MWCLSSELGIPLAPDPLLTPPPPDIELSYLHYCVQGIVLVLWQIKFFDIKMDFDSGATVIPIEIALQISYIKLTLE